MDTDTQQRMDAQELRARREYLGLTTEALAIALDVRHDTVRQWERGRTPVPYRVAGELAVVEAYAAEMVDLLRGHPEDRQWFDSDAAARFALRRDWATARLWRHCMIRAMAEDW